MKRKLLVILGVVLMGVSVVGMGATTWAVGNQQAAACGCDANQTANELRKCINKCLNEHPDCKSLSGEQQYSCIRNSSGAATGSASSAAAEVTTGAATTQDGQCGNAILGFKPWYDGDGLCVGGNIVGPTGTTSDPSGDKLAAYVWTIVLNIVFDLSLAVGYLAVGMVIYGGYLYIMSSGDVSKAAKGQKTLTNATVGVVIAMGATVIVNTLQFALGISGGGWKQEGDTAARLQGVFNWAYGMAGVVAVVFIIKAGATYLLSRGDPGKVQQATRSLIFSSIGLVIVLLAAVITGFVINAVGGAL